MIVLALTLWWLRDHPWRSVVLVLAGAVLVTVVRIPASSTSASTAEQT